jgi:Rieske Fe-S protein
VLPEVKAGRLHCPCHAGYFRLETGEVISGPPRRRLPRIELEVRDEMIYAIGIEETIV